MAYRMGHYGFPAPCGGRFGWVKRAFKQQHYFPGAMLRGIQLFALIALGSALAGWSAVGVAEESRVTPAHPSANARMVSIPPAPVQRLADGGEEIVPVFRDYFRLPDPAQVRIEQRVTIRISPRPAPVPMAVFSSNEGRDMGEPRTIERKMGKCVPLGGVLGVQSGGGNKLLLFMRGQRLVSATLEKACQGRDYYSGFLVAQHADGQLCVDRDEILARSGAKCKVKGYREIMLVED
jgi:hypothetical protein